MSQGRFSDPPLAPEDDWFLEPGAARSARRVEPGDSHPGRPEPPRPPRLEGPRDRRILLAVVVGAIVFVAGVVAVAVAVTGSDGGGEAVAPTPPVTTPTTTAPEDTTPAPTTTPPATTPTPTPTTLPEGVTLRRGDQSEAVSQLQAALVELGYSTGGVDGKFGPATEEAVRAFQASSDLTEDGVVGPATLTALAAALDEQ